ncbi:hypothetical protein NMG60_11023117 [Bertholletia excelsa]
MAEEDEVLINHVKKYGPRDWSSIRSKGLLRRTGKSCRLRWVNKLRPNLKSGVKFSAEEERTVIELQGQFGNKWAKIATYLPGRTDNDVKNFWSSRQKRLARLLHSPSSSSPSSSSYKPHKKNGEIAPLHHVQTQVKFISWTEESSSSSSSSSSSLVHSSQIIKMVPFPDLINPSLLNCDHNLIQLEYNPDENNPTHELQPQVPRIPIDPNLQPDVPFPFGALQTFNQLGDLLDPFGHSGASDLGALAELPPQLNPTQLYQSFPPPSLDGTELPLVPPCLGSEVGCQGAAPDSFFDDLPVDMFEQIEPFPSPSEW